MRHRTLVIPSSLDLLDIVWSRFLVLPVEIAGTILAFAFLLLTLIIAIPFGFLSQLLNANHPRTAWNKVFRPLIRLYLFAAGVRIEVNGLEYLPTRTQPVVFAANHPSHLDGPIFETFVDRRAFALTMPIDSFPFPFSFWFRKIGSVDVARSPAEERKYPRANTRKKAIRVSIWKLTTLKKSLLIFPEGHLERGKKVLPFKTGAVRIALKAGVPIVPVSIKGTDRVFSPSRWLFRPGRIHVTLHPPMDLRPYHKTQLNRKQIDWLTAQLVCRIASGLPEHRLTPGLKPFCMEVIHQPPGIPLLGVDLQSKRKSPRRKQQGHRARASVKENLAI